MSGADISTDIGAVVLDVGSNSIRVGFAGEEMPRLDIPSHYGLWEDEKKHNRFNFGTIALHVNRGDMEVKTFLKDGMIDDWGDYERCIEYIFNHRLHTEISHNPMIITEPAWNVQPKREYMAELMFEKFDLPAIYLSKSPALVGITNSRAACLVLDSGATHTTATPVHDGCVYTAAIVKSPAGGDYILDKAQNMLNNRNIEIVPYYKVESKEVVKADDPACYRENVCKATTSWRKYMIREVLQDFHSSVLQISDMPYDEEIVKTIPTVHYEFPNGFNRDYGVERFAVAESLFNLSDRTDRNGNNLHPSLDISSMITTSIGMCDVEQRPGLYMNILVTGGNSSMNGFVERLQRDLAAKMTSNMKFKVHSQNGTDRRFAAWNGGSIVGSLSAFQTYWVSRAEYDEFGKSIVASRC